MSIISNYPNEFLANPAHIFGHRRKSPYDLISLIDVKDMCYKNKNAFAAGIMIHGVYNTFFHKNDNKNDRYIREAAYRFASLETVNKDRGIHGGDCTKACGSCSLCINEGLYVEGLCDLCYFEDLINIQSTEIKTKYDDSTVLFMTICQLQEKYWNDFDQHYDEHGCFEKGKNPPDYVECLRKFFSLPENEQQEKYNRMVKVKEYIDNPTPIEGIPWW